MSNRTPEQELKYKINQLQIDNNNCTEIIDDLKKQLKQSNMINILYRSIITDSLKG